MNVKFEFTWRANVVFICRISWKNAERLFLDAMEKIKAIGSEVTANLYELLRCHHDKAVLLFFKF